MSISSHKIYKTSARQGLSASEGSALLLEEAAKNMQAACAAITEGNIEARYKETEKAALILGHMEKAVTPAGPDQAETATALKTFYNDMVTLITRVNFKNEASTAQSIADSLQKMATEFRKVSTLYTQQIQSQAPSDTPEKNLQMGA